MWLYDFLPFQLHILTYSIDSDKFYPISGFTETLLVETIITKYFDTESNVVGIILSIE